jgi:exopolysaccharide biosynthesis polyprenyl glycosylphosphotransferase
LTFKYRRTINTLARLTFMAALVAAFYAVWQWAYTETTFFDLGNYVVMLSYAGMMTLFMAVYGGLRVGSLRITNLFLSCFFALFFANFFIYLELSLIARAMLKLWPILALQGAQTVLALLGCYVMNTVYYALNSVRDVVAIYGGDAADEAVARKMGLYSRQFRIARVLSAEAPLDEIRRAMAPYDSVLLGAMDAGRRRDIFNECYRLGKRVNIIPDPADIALSVAHQTQLADTPILLCKNRELTPEQRLVKRLMDLVIAAAMLVIVSPVMLLVALIIKLQDGGPVFYRQARLTAGGQPFNIIKFRSMCVDADRDRQHETLRAVNNDERITSIGAFLRRYRLDELPQLLNVLAGDMSVVGPRPERVEHYDLYTRELPAFSLRLRVKAGLTGYAQIYGRYNTTPRDKLNMDLFYIESYSLLQDLRLLFMTVKVLFLPESTQGFADLPQAQRDDPAPQEREQDAG